jgi:hypothetical protein
MSAKMPRALARRMPYGVKSLIFVLTFTIINYKKAMLSIESFCQFVNLLDSYQ